MWIFERMVSYSVFIKVSLKKIIEYKKLKICKLIFLNFYDWVDK